MGDAGSRRHRSAGHPDQWAAAVANELAPDRAVTEALIAAGVAPGPRTAAQRAEVDARLFAPLLADLLTRSREAARSGADIVVWAEASAFTFLEDRQDLLDRARAVAREEQIYLRVGVVHLLPTTVTPFTEIRGVLIDPGGEIRWDCLKTSTPLDDGNVPGPGVLPTVDTPYGRLSTVICGSHPGRPNPVRAALRRRAGLALDRRPGDRRRRRGPSPHRAPAGLPV